MAAMCDEAVTLARARSPRGDVALRRRGGVDAPVHELIVNGVFAMDDVETSTERALARCVAEAAHPSGRVLLGGLGLGHTAAELLDLGVGRLDVVEIEADLVEWAGDGVTPQLGRVARDPRVRLVVGDLHDVLSGTSRLDGPWEAILLDVDNGPDFLVHDADDRLYGERDLAAAWAQVSPGGVLAIWCQGPVPALAHRLVRLGIPAVEQRHPTVREGRELGYAIYRCERTTASPS